VTISPAIPWIPSLPSSWKVQRAKTLIYRSKALNSDRDEKQVLSLTLRGVVDNDPENPEGLVPEDYATYQLFEPDDLVFKLIDLENVRTSRVGLVPKRGIMSSAYLRLRPRPGTCVRFLYWSFFDLYNRQIFNHLGSGVRSTLGADDLLNLPLPVPDAAAQLAIADYLDRETARIDALITKKQRMIELLEEKSRRAIGEMTRQGVNPAAEQVESGLSWVGKIPAHWQVVPNRSTMRIVRRPVTPGREPTLLSLTKRGVIVRDVSENFGKFPATFDNYQIVHAKELVFCLFDIPETPRTVGLSEQIGMVTGAYVVAAAQGGNLPEFIRYLYEGFDDEKSLSLFYTGLRKVIRPDAFMSIRMPLPPEAEQQAIVGELDRLVGSSREAVRLLSKQIDLLRERRQALITAAVTGELEVPGVAA
jgi:type I restriction enzyme S subunit